MKMQNKKIFSSLLLAVAVVFFSIGCGQNSGAGNKDTTATESEEAKPTKEQMISDLKTFYKHMKEENFKAAGKFFVTEKREGFEISDILEDYADRVFDEISDEGIKILKKEGEFDKLEELFPSKASRWLDGAGLDESKLKNCYAIKFEGARIVGYWSGQHFKFFELNNIAKLAEDETESDNESSGTREENNENNNRDTAHSY